jgi:hypothetical protein
MEVRAIKVSQAILARLVRLAMIQYGCESVLLAVKRRYADVTG